MKKVYVFWTGGWDSTYRIVELSRMKDITIQPIYILDPNRTSRDNELKSIKTITELLKQHPETHALINDPIIKNVHDIPENKDISEAAKKLKEENGLGEQHDWTARVALQYPGVEMCIEKALPGSGYTPIRDTLEKYASLVETSHGIAIDSQKSDKIVKLVFENIVLPVFEITEVEMLANIKEWKYEEIMSHIWFCHRPIHGKPCGMCSPCHTKRESDMLFLLPSASQKRGVHLEWIKKHLGKYVAIFYAKAVRMIG